MAASSSSQLYHAQSSSTQDQPAKLSKKSKLRKGKEKENIPLAVQKGQGHTSTDRDDNVEPDLPWDWTPLTDPSASKVPPIFTKDGNYFFSLVGSSVKIHSVSTGEVISTLCAPPPTSSVPSSSLLTTATLNPCNPFQLITGSLDGRLVVWDFMDAALLKVIDIAQPIHYICAHESFKDSIFVAASRPVKKTKINGIDENAVVLRVSLKTGDDTKSTEICPIGKTRFPTGLTLSPSGVWLIATAGHKVYVALLSSLKSGFTKYVSPERLTCLAFHPTEEYFATGDEKGGIRLWYCLNDDLPINLRGVEKKTQTTLLHWHAHAVSSIAFTSNGAYLLSGGEESVLVIWQLHTGKKEFVPRIGAPINTVSLSKVVGSEEEYLIGLADATYLFINVGTLKISRMYSRIKLDPAVPSTSRVALAPLAIHTLTSTLILPSSHPSSLQIYSPSSSKLVTELEVSPSNRVSRRDEKPIEPSRVEHVVISASGEWLASIDTRDGNDGFRGEIYLKLWRWDYKSINWILNTRIDRPHGLEKVTCMSFSPPSSMDDQTTLVTAGGDFNAKTWGLKTAKDNTGVLEEFWTTRSIFNFHSDIPSSVSWSPDASLLAICLGAHVSVYNPTTHTLIQTLTSPECKLVSSAHFVGRSGRFLAVAGKNNLVLWDLVTQCVRWNYKSTSRIENLVPHPEDDSFAIFYGYTPNQTRASIFGPASPVPLGIHSLPFKLRSLSLECSRERFRYTFFGITDDWRIVQFGDSAKMIGDTGFMAKGLVLDSAPTRRTLFQDIFGKSAFMGTSRPPVSIDAMPKLSIGREASAAFNYPAYLMPPLEQLFDPIINGFLKPSSQVQPLLDGCAEPDDQDINIDEEVSDKILLGTRTRVIDQEEITTFIDLFRKHSVAAIHATNGNNQLRPNTSLSDKQHITPQHKSSTPEQDASFVSPTTTILKSKKRKNSLS